ncbi:MAG: GGDEF domain-containing protein [Sulfitobacter sp.]
MAFLAASVSIASQFEEFQPALRSLSQHHISIRTLLLLLLLIIAATLPPLLMYNRLYKARAVIKNQNQQISDFERQFRTSEIERMTDVISGIPNQAQFSKDLENIVAKTSALTPFHMIFMDLSDFGSVNKKFGYDAGDDVIEYFAQSVYDGMRRNEEFYKLPFDERLEDGEHWKRAYRKYTGGDEFIFLISGTEPDAIGFLTRLQRRVAKELNPHIQHEILKSAEWSLSFSAAVIPIHLNDTETDIFQRAHEGMRKARQPGNKMRVFWASKKRASDIDKDHWSYKFYLEAEEWFFDTK